MLWCFQKHFKSYIKVNPNTCVYWKKLRKQDVKNILFFNLNDSLPEIVFAEPELTNSF